MNIVSKEINSDGSEFLIYLMDENGNPVKAQITNKDNKEKVINDLQFKHVLSDTWLKSDRDLDLKITEITYNDYIK